MKQAKKASPTPAPAAPAATLPSSLAALNGRVAEINARHKIVTAEILRLEQAGVKISEYAPSPRDAGSRLLAGEVEPSPIWSEPEAKLAALHRERAVMSEALKMADARSRQLSLAEGSARYEARKSEQYEIVRQMVSTVLALEHELQALDRFRCEVKAGFPLNFDGWPMLGRLHDRAGQAFRFLHAARQEKIIDQKLIDDEIARADQARKECINAKRS
jgi:hypothetical protein